MADKLTGIRIKQGDTYSNQIPIWTKTQHVAYDNENTLSEVLGTINTNKGTIGEQLDSLQTGYTSVRYAVGSPLTAASASDMTQTSKVYVYTGTTTASLTNGHWYYYDDTLATPAWTDGGVYNETAIETDKTLSIENKAADAKAVSSLIQVNETSTAATKVNIDISNSTDYVLAQMSDIEDINQNFNVLKYQLNFHPTIKKGQYLARVGGEVVSGNSAKNYARTQYLNAAKNEYCKTIIVLDNENYKFRVLFYNTSTISSSSYLNNSSDMITTGTYYFPSEPATYYFGINFQRIDNANITDSDVTAISNALHFYNLTDTSLSQYGKAADAGAVGKTIEGILTLKSIKNIAGSSLSNILQIPDAANKKAKSIITKIVPSQSGTPSQADPQSITGVSTIYIKNLTNNLYDSLTYNYNKAVGISTGNLYTPQADTGDWCVSDYICTQNKTKIYFRFYNSTPTAHKYTIAYYDKNKNFLSYSTSSSAIASYSYSGFLTLNLPTNTFYIRLAHAKTSHCIICLDAQSTITVSLPQTVYGGEYNITTGKLTITKKCINNFDPTNQDHLNAVNGTTWISSLSVQEGNSLPIQNSQVVYDLSSPEEISLDPHNIQFFEGQNLLLVYNSYPNMFETEVKYLAKAASDNTTIQNIKTNILQIKNNKNLMKNTLFPGTAQEDRPKIGDDLKNIYWSGTFSTVPRGIKLSNTSAKRTIFGWRYTGKEQGIHLGGLIPGHIYTISFDLECRMFKSTVTDGSIRIYYYENHEPFIDSGRNNIQVYGIYGSNMSKQLLYIGNQSTQILKKQHCYFTFFVNPNTTSILLYIGGSKLSDSNYTSNDYLQISNIMLNEGREPFEYTPNTDDLQKLNLNEDDNNDIISFNDPVQTKSKLRLMKWANNESESAPPLLLIHFSDIHGSQKPLENIVKYKEAYSNYITDAIHTGDTVYKSYASGIQFWNNVEGAEKILNVIGNHDTDVSNDWNAKTMEESYARYMAPFIENWGVTYSVNKTYYYKDYPDNKIRLIVLDMMKRYDQGQKSWFVNILEEARLNNYHVIAACHCKPWHKMIINSTPWQDAGITTNTGSRYWSNSATANMPWNLQEFYVNEVDNFLDNGGKFACWLHGHMHCKYFCQLDAPHQRQFDIGVGTASDKASQDLVYKHTAGTRDYDNFNVISISTSNSLIRLLKVGAQYDRFLRKIDTITFKYNTLQMFTSSDVIINPIEDAEEYDDENDNNDNEENNN